MITAVKYSEVFAIKHTNPIGDNVGYQVPSTVIPVVPVTNIPVKL
jgi:hypothetical protein